MRDKARWLPRTQGKTEGKGIPHGGGYAGAVGMELRGWDPDQANN